LILCDAILQEFERVLKKKFAASPSEISEVLAILSEAAWGIRRRIDTIAPVCKDPDDDLILACARESVADYIVTGDEDLLALKDYQGTSIISPREFERLFPD